MMWRQLLKSCCTGLAAGVAINELIALAASYVLRLGYYMPCLASLPEQVGGELNAVTLQMILCGLVGMTVGILCRARMIAHARASRHGHNPADAVVLYAVR